MVGRWRRSSLLIIAVVMLCSAVSPAGAQTVDPRERQRQLRERRAQLAAQLDTLKASESQLLGAAAALDDQVLAQAARVDAARQALASAEREAAEAARAAQETRTQVDATKRALVERVVSEFMSPSNDLLDDVAPSDDPTEAVRRRALAESVNASEDELLDELRAVEEDYESQRARAEGAAQTARARRAEAAARLERLEADQASQRRLVQAVTVRQQEVLSEITAHAQAESELNRIIAERTEAARRQAAARQRESAPSGAAAPDSPAPDVRQGGGGCIWPTQGRVTSEYGRRSGRQHQGMDIAAPTGTRISAAKDGVVVFAGQQSGYGNVIVIDHGAMTTLYAHQSRLAASDGQSVRQGQQIGYVGNTGRSTGPHLHFETRYGGAARNPRSCLP